MFGIIAHASTQLPCTDVGTSGNCAVPISGFNQLFGNVLGIIIPFAAVGLFIMITIGGFKYITSAGNPKATEAAKNTITYAILGIVLIASAYLILTIVQTLTGADVTQFNVVVSP